MIGVELSAGEWALACLLGAVIGLDGVSWPQVMWSRPIVAGTVGGALFGAPGAGCVVGAWLELVLSRHPPFGGARHPETGPASFTAGAAFALAGGGPIGIAGAVAVGWAVGWTGAYSLALLRRVTPGLVSRPEGFRGGAAALARRHRLATALDGLRGGLLVAALFVPSILFLRLLTTQPARRNGAGLVAGGRRARARRRRRRGGARTRCATPPLAGAGRGRPARNAPRPVARMRPRASDFLRAMLRSFSAQGSWNYRTMAGPGLGHALAPLLARIYAHDPAAFGEAVRRHSRAFNAHPYFLPVAVGALARLEFEGAEPDTMSRFRSALGAPLGALGDGIAWAGWRPFCACSAAIGCALGLDPLVAAASFLLVYNAGHLALRIWGLRCGWRSGLSVAAALKEVPFRRVERGLVLANQVLTGFLAALLIGRLGGMADSPLLAGGAVIIALMGYLAPRHISAVAMASLLAACAVWLL